MNNVLQKTVTKKKKKSGISYCKNYCLLSGRGHSIYSKFQLARNELKRTIHKGLLYGVRKASW